MAFRRREKDSAKRRDPLASRRPGNTSLSINTPAEGRDCIREIVYPLSVAEEALRISRHRRGRGAPRSHEYEAYPLESNGTSARFFLPSSSRALAKSSRESRGRIYAAAATETRPARSYIVRLPILPAEGGD